MGCFLEKGTLSRGILCFQRLECMPEKEGMRLETGLNEFKPRGRLSDLIGS